MKLIIASNNKGKIREIKEILGTHFESVISMKEAGIELDVVEDGKTFLENAAKKANETLALAAEDVAVLADDSGLEVDALDGAPGVYSARFAGEGHDDNANNSKLLELMQNVPDEKRGANFACAMVLARHNKPNIEAVGKCYGKILHESAGENGFGYDPLFYSTEENASFAQIPADRKNAISHRRRAIEGICKQLDEEKK